MSVVGGVSRKKLKEKWKKKWMNKKIAFDSHCIDLSSVWLHVHTILWNQFPFCFSNFGWLPDVCYHFEKWMIFKLTT